MKPIALLMLEDSPLDAELVAAHVYRTGVPTQIERVETRSQYETALDTGKFDLILSDYALPDFDGLTALEIARERVPSTPFIFVSGTLGEDVAIDSLQKGATDYVLKNRLERLVPAIQRAVKEHSERQRRLHSERELKASEAKFRELADALPQLVWATDMSGAIIYMNRHAREYAGSRNEQQTPPGIEIAHPGEKYELMAHWTGHLSKGETFKVECRLLRSRDNTYRWHLIRFAPMQDETGKINGWLVAAVDVEEQKRREHALRASEEALLNINQTLEQKVEERTEAYRKLSARLLSIQDAERRKIARELHDSLGQYLTGLKINLDLLNQTDSLSQEKRAELLSLCVGVLDNCIREARTTSYLLHPPLLDEAGLAHAFRWYVDGFGQRSGIHVHLDLPPAFGRLPEDIEVVLFRVLQESLTNVHRHAESPSVEITLTCDAEHVRLEIKDCGRGIEKERLTLLREGKADFSVGLPGMRERVHELGGCFDLASSSSGTSVVVSVPLTRSSRRSWALQSASSGGLEFA